LRSKFFLQQHRSRSDVVSRDSHSEPEVRAMFTVPDKEKLRCYPAENAGLRNRSDYAPNDVVVRRSSSIGFKKDVRANPNVFLFTAV
jgi:hypothetical protein